MFVKTAIVYASVHHGNTQKVVDAIAKEYVVDLIDATKIKFADLSEYDVIGFASGIFFGKFHRSVLDFARENLPEGKKVFFISTYGSKEGYSSIDKIAEAKNALIIDKYGCKGWDTFGVFALVGGIQKGHPDKNELADAVQFYRDLVHWILAS
ncbi:MAG: flavodoxin family protein [Lachnospiraceae bacterium]|nr:flavodoxin family protein [Lachnospiraceae bacterium]